MIRRLARLLVVALAVAVVAGACGSSGGDKDADAASATAPENQRASAAEVATGLHKIEGIAKDIAAAAGSDKSRAKELSEQIEPVWQGIEGTVKANDQDTYVTFEDSFAALGRAADDGDGAKASKAAGDVSATVDAYLAKHPG